MFLSVVHSLLLLSARLESGGKGGGGTAFNDSISCLWTTAVPSLQRQMLSVLPLWFRLQSKQETQRLKNTAPAWTSQTCITTVPLKCTTALSPGKWKVIVFADVACVRLTRNSPPSNFAFAWFSDVFEMRKTAHECVVLESIEGNYSFVFFFKCHRLEPLWKKNSADFNRCVHHHWGEVWKQNSQNVGGGGVQTCQNPKVVYQETTLIRGQNHIHSAWSQEEEGLHGRPVRNGKNRL